MRRQHARAINSAHDLFFTPGNNFDATDYCNKLAIAYEEERQNSHGTGWVDVFRMPDLRRLLIAVGIQSLQQAQGSSYMNSYIVSFLQVSDSDAATLTTRGQAWRMSFPSSWVSTAYT